ncbi:hypothetical protein HYU16_04470 [Candidatus Woesearchaeota archaeon]|nr:hypothetical protein [Candidatus Woesearchaeota archaeon]
MLYDNLKKLAVIGIFAVAAVVAIYIFALFGARPATPNETAEQAAEIAAQPSQATEPAEPARPSLPAGVTQAICEKYADIPDDVVPCQPALDFVIQNYGSDISSFGLMAEAADGTIRPFVAGQPVAEGTKLVWLASSHQSGAVLLDAKDLSVAKEKT